jgi:hypothetical protein
MDKAIIAAQINDGISWPEAFVFVGGFLALAWLIGKLLD